MKGRKPKPTHLKIIDGERNKNRINRKEPKPKTKRPRCPQYLSQEAKRAWKILAPRLDRLGLLTEIDGQAFEGLCQAYGRWVEAERELAKTDPILRGKKIIKVKDKDGNEIEKQIPGGYFQNPYLAVANRAWEQMMKAFAEFGLTPSSRSRISVGGPSGGGGIEELID